MRVLAQKANFIRSRSDSMSAKDIVETAAKQGLKISVNHVYNLRTMAKSSNAVRALSATRASKIGIGRPRARTGPTGVERQLRNEIAEVGLLRAREIFEEIAGVFRGG